MRETNPLWRNAKLVLAVAMTFVVAALWSHEGGPAGDSAAQAQYAPRPAVDRSNGSDAAIMAAREIVFKRYEAIDFDWTAEDAADKSAEEISRVASVIIRNYRPYAVPDREERREPRLRIIPPEQGQQP